MPNKAECPHAYTPHTTQLDSPLKNRVCSLGSKKTTTIQHTSTPLYLHTRSRKPSRDYPWGGGSVKRANVSDDRQSSQGGECRQGKPASWLRQGEGVVATQMITTYFRKSASSPNKKGTHQRRNPVMPADARNGREARSDNIMMNSTSLDR